MTHSKWTVFGAVLLYIIIVSTCSVSELRFELVHLLRRKLRVANAVMTTVNKKNTPARLHVTFRITLLPEKVKLKEY